MPCDPSSNLLNPPVSPGIPVPGFGLPTSPVQPPIPGFELPDGFPESVLELIQQLQIPWPGGILSPQIDNFSATLLKAVMNVFNQLMPWLSLYKFFLAALDLIVCIIEILCALTNPFKLIRAMRKLIKQCLPPFLNLFPWLALISMIISLMILLISLIIYVISRILAIIDDLLNNLELLSKGVTLQDAEATAAIGFKIASLLCIIENLMAMFSAIAAIFNIIDALSQIGGAGICSTGSNSDCCGEDVCPPFIKNNPNGIDGTKGKLIYYNQIIDPTKDDNPFFNTFFGVQSNTIRAESWQFVNDDVNQEYPFKDIITRYKDNSTQRNDNSGSSSFSEDYEYGDIFWPEGQKYDKNSSLRKVPYNVNITLKDFSFNAFDNDVSDKTTRTVFIRNAVVESKPYVGEKDKSGDIKVGSEFNNFGTLSILGGVAYEEDKETLILDSNGNQVTIEDLVHLNPKYQDQLPTTDDGYNIEGIDFVLNINHASLMDYNLTVAGCVPDIAIETQQLNDRYAEAFIPIISKVGDLPDIAKAQSCVSNVLSNLRKDVTIEAVESARADMVACLEELKDEAEDTLCRAFFAGVDPYSSSFEIEPDLQFINRSIKVTVTLRDRLGVNISNNIPDDCLSDVLESLGGEVSLGKLSEFTYENNVFVANITSDIGGDGEVRITWNNNVLLEILNEDNPDVDTSVQEKVLNYTFVGTSAALPKNRRDATDVSEE